MSSPRVRPVFFQQLAGEPAVFFDALRGALAADGGRCRAHYLEEGAILRLRHDERKLWSPALHLHVEDGEGKATLRGQFSPSSPVWTAFIAIYIALACVLLASVSYGGAQWTLGETPWALWGAPIALALAGFTYGAAFIGQGLGAEDMHELRSVVERVAGQASTPRR